MKPYHSAKKNGACVFWAPVFFSKFLAGKLRHSKQMLLTEFHESEKKRMRILGARFF